MLALSRVPRPSPSNIGRLFCPTHQYGRLRKRALLNKSAAGDSDTMIGVWRTSGHDVWMTRSPAPRKGGRARTLLKVGLTGEPVRRPNLAESIWRRIATIGGVQLALPPAR